MALQQSFKIRDKRDKGRFWLDNEYLNGYAKIFRAFTQEGQMIPVGSLELFTDGTYRVNDEIPIGNGKLMQFTGLLDKNGKEIYEGDVVEHLSQQRIYKNVPHFVVQWNSILCGWNIRSNREGDSLHKIIGNIYENPDLLTPTGKMRTPRLIGL